MTIEFHQRGNPEKPILVCLTGLLGTPNDFDNLLEGFDKEFCFLLPEVDPDAPNDEIMNYHAHSNRIYQELKQNYSDRSAYFVGLSVGAKTVFHFASDFPDSFLGAIVTDMSPGFIDNSELFRRLIGQDSRFNLEQDWKGIKKQIQDQFEDRNLQVLIKSLIRRPDPKVEKFEWNNAMFGIEKAILNNCTDELWNSLKEVSPKLEEKGAFFHLFRAEFMSGITDEDQEKLDLIPAFRTNFVPKASHFLHISHGHLLRACLEKFQETKNGTTQIASI